MKYTQCEHGRIVDVNGKLKSSCEECIRKDERVKFYAILTAIKDIPATVLQTLQSLV